MAIAETQVYMPQAPRPRLRLLEDERWLAFVLLAPTLVLLAMFIAYPFLRGILLSVTDARVGVPGNFVGLANFYKIFNDGIFRTSVYNTFLYTGVTTVFKLALGLWLAMLLNRNFRGKAFTRAFVVRLEVDVRPDIQRSQLAALSFRPDHRPDQLARRSGPRHDLDHHRQHLARGAVLRHQPARRPADHQSRTQRGGCDRRRQAMAAVLAHHLAAVAARDHGRGAVLGDSDVRRLPDRLCDDGWRTGQRNPSVRHLRLSDRDRHRPFERGRGDRAHDVSDPVSGRHHPASLHPPRRGPLSHDRRRKVANVGVLLRPDGAVPGFPAVSVLLDGDHFGAAGWRALPALELNQLQSVLDLETDLGPRQIPVRGDAVR